MAGLSFGFKVIGLRQLQRKLESDLIKSPLAQGIRKITLFPTREIKKATPRGKSGELRSGIVEQITPFRGLIGTNVNYASFVEYGHKQTPGRYIPAIGKRLINPWVFPSRTGNMRDMGPFTYGMKLVQSKVKDFLKDIGKDIQVRWER